MREQCAAWDRGSLARSRDQGGWVDVEGAGRVFGRVVHTADSPALAQMFSLLAATHHQQLSEDFCVQVGPAHISLRGKERGGGTGAHQLTAFASCVSNTPSACPPL